MHMAYSKFGAFQIFCLFTLEYLDVLNKRFIFTFQSSFHTTCFSAKQKNPSLSSHIYFWKLASSISLQKDVPSFWERDSQKHTSTSTVAGCHHLCQTSTGSSYTTSPNHPASPPSYVLLLKSSVCPSGVDIWQPAALQTCLPNEFWSNSFKKDLKWASQL